MTLTADDPLFPTIAHAQTRWVQLYRTNISRGHSHMAARRLAYRTLESELGLLSDAKRARVIRCVENME